MSTEMTSDQIDEFLARHYVAHLGLVDDDRPYVVPISYAYDEGMAYFHTTPGTKLHALRSQPEVCFEVDEVTSIDQWQSVIAWGTFEQLTGTDAQDAVKLLVDRLRPLSAAGSETSPGAEIGLMRTLDIPRLAGAADEIGHAAHAAVVFRIELNSATGRSEGEGVVRQVN